MYVNIATFEWHVFRSFCIIHMYLYVRIVRLVFIFTPIPTKLALAMHGCLIYRKPVQLGVTVSVIHLCQFQAFAATLSTLSSIGSRVGFLCQWLTRGVIMRAHFGNANHTLGRLHLYANSVQCH